MRKKCDIILSGIYFIGFVQTDSFIIIIIADCKERDHGERYKRQ